MYVGLCVLDVWVISSILHLFSLRLRVWLLFDDLLAEVHWFCIVCLQCLWFSGDFWWSCSDVASMFYVFADVSIIFWWTFIHWASNFNMFSYWFYGFSLIVHRFPIILIMFRWLLVDLHWFCIDLRYFLCFVQVFVCG